MIITTVWTRKLAVILRSMLVLAVVLGFSAVAWAQAPEVSAPVPNASGEAQEAGDKAVDVAGDIAEINEQVADPAVSDSENAEPVQNSTSSDGHLAQVPNVLEEAQGVINKAHNVADDVSEINQHATDPVMRDSDNSEPVKAVTPNVNFGDDKFYRLQPCKFMICDKVGRTLVCPRGTTLSLRLQPESNTMFLNGRHTIKLGGRTIDGDTWTEVALDENGVGEVDLAVPVADKAGVLCHYQVRLHGSEGLSSASLQNDEVVVTSRGTSGDLEVLYLTRSIRSSWELGVLLGCPLLTVVLAWVWSSKVRHAVWNEQVSQGNAQADVVAGMKKSKCFVPFVILARVGFLVAFFKPMVNGAVPYLGVWCGSLLPLLILAVVKTLNPVRQV